MAAPNWPAIRAGIFAGESGGDYDALFGFSNRPRQPFSNVRLTNMTVDDALSFASPSGPYGQWVKNKIGRVATPMGGYQVVGTTLKAAKQGLGLTGKERMTPETQERIGQWIFANQGTGAWEGYKGPGDPSAYPIPSSLPGKVGGDSMVARNHDPEVAAQTNSPVFGLGGAMPGGSPSNPLPAGLGAYWAGDEKKGLGSILASAFSALADFPDAPAGHLGGGGDARSTADMLGQALNKRGAIGRGLLQKRI